MLIASRIDDVLGHLGALYASDVPGPATGPRVVDEQPRLVQMREEPSHREGVAGRLLRDRLGERRDLLRVEAQGLAEERHDGPVSSGPRSSVVSGVPHSRMRVAARASAPSVETSPVRQVPMTSTPRKSGSIAIAARSFSEAGSTHWRSSRNSTSTVPCSTSARTNAMNTA